MRSSLLLLAIAALLPETAWAQEREFCPDRPGIGTPACTMSPGRTSLEVGLASWTLDRNSDEREDSFLFGDTLIRRGIAEHAEVQVGLTMLGTARTRDRTSGEISRQTTVGDLTVALRRNIQNPDGDGFSLALMPFVTVPVGKSPIASDRWAAGVLVPSTFALSDAVSLEATTEFDAEPDEEGHGRHFAASEVLGATFALTKALSATAEYQVLVDLDPDDKHVEHLSGLSLGWMPSERLQLDIGANFALDHDAPDAEVYLGFARYF